MRDSAKWMQWACCVVLAGVIGCCPDFRSLQPGRSADVILRYDWYGNIDKVRLKEPSGIVFHPQRGTLFAVGDEGHICELRTDGAVVKLIRLSEADYEGITVDPASGLLYVAIEGEEKIVEIDPDTFEVLREWEVERWAGGVEVFRPGGNGIEAITFVPQSDHPHGGTFYVCNQSFSLDPQDEMSALVELEVPLNGQIGTQRRARIIRYFRMNVIDLSGLHYDPARGRLLACGDANNVLLEITLNGEVARLYAFPGDNQEGIAMDDEGLMYIAQDSGGILKIRPHW